MSIRVLAVVTVAIGLVSCAGGGNNNPNPVGPGPVARALTFTVNPPNLPPATIGQQYSQSFCDPKPAPGLFCGGPLPANPPTNNPTGGTPHYNFSTGVGYPFGLGMNLNGVLEGTPTNVNTAGRTYTFDVCVTDQVSARVCVPVSIQVLQAALRLVRYSGQFNCPRAGFGYQCTGTIDVEVNRPIDAGTRVRAEIENSLLGGTATADGVSTTMRFNVNQGVVACPFRNPDRFRLVDVNRNTVLASGDWNWSTAGC